MLIWLTIVVLIALAAWAATYFGYQQWQKRQRCSHDGLFTGLCRAHELDGRARSLLRQVARCYNMSQPARLFTEPKWLFAQGLRQALPGRNAELAVLREKLFG
ncbi:MAG: hypothetical protein ACOY3P_04810 [Planctomycetota bacterium]